MMQTDVQNSIGSGRSFNCLKRSAAVALFIGFATGCGPHRILPQTRYLSEERVARVPAGVVRYCWEEPMVQLEPNGPGLDAEEQWYHPSYLAVREVRQGKWRP